MTTKRMTLRAIDLISGLGNDHGEGVPFRWLTSMVEKVRAAVPDDEEQTCFVHGAAGLTFVFEHQLTEVESLRDELSSLQAKAAAIKALFHPDGTLVTGAAEKLRELLG